MYTDRYCLFLDILGFSEHVRDSYRKDQVDHSKVEEIASMLGRLPVKVNSFIEENPNRTITQFSDSIVVSFDVNDPNGIEHLLIDTLRITATFMVNDYLVRGGLSLGKLYHTERVVFGPAMIDAYELESQIANYPRVIFDPEIIESISNSKKNGLFWNEDYDGKWYFDYFHGPRKFMNDYEYRNYLEHIRTFIQKGLRNRTSQRVRVKYGWLKSKYNTLAHELDLKLVR